MPGTDNPAVEEVIGHINEENIFDRIYMINKISVYCNR